MTEPGPDAELEAALDPELDALLGRWCSGTVQVGKPKRPIEVPRQEHIAWALGCAWIDVLPDGYEFECEGCRRFARDMASLKEEVNRIRTRRR